MGSMTMHDAVQRALDAEPCGERDKAVAALALLYADEIDACEEGALKDVGPKLLQALEALQMSPRARAIAKKGAAADGPARQSKMDELRERRARKNPGPNGTTAVDTTA